MSCDRGNTARRIRHAVEESLGVALKSDTVCNAIPTFQEGEVRGRPVDGMAAAAAAMSMFRDLGIDVDDNPAASSLVDDFESGRLKATPKHIAAMRSNIPEEARSRQASPPTHKLERVPDGFHPEVEGEALEMLRILQQPGPQGAAWQAHVDELAARIKQGDFPDTMTPREILALYQGADNDRLYWYENGRGSRDWWENEPSMWARKAQEARTGEYRHRMPPFPDDDDDKLPPAPTRESPGFEHPSEAEGEKYPQDGYVSLFDDIADRGSLKPVPLSSDFDDQGWMGRAMILGGHHRLAVLLLTNPDSPVPVSFHKTMKHAKTELGEEY